MKLAITSTGRELDSNLDSRFGRAAYFIVVDLDTMAFEVVENSQKLDFPQGAGIQAGKTIADHRVDVLITGHRAPKAFKVLQKAGVEVMTGSGGRVIDAIAQFVHGELEISAEADVEGHRV
ncbi:MAG: NifB/NifX family molybdenum-iron cluster-binding protein [Desulfobacterales bacterium]